MPFDWIGDHADALSFFTSLGTLAVWAVYAQLLLSNFRRERTARIVINRGSDAGLASVCMIGNMGKEPMFVECIMAVLHTQDRVLTRSITDGTESAAPASADTLKQITRQGPLRSGDVMNLGTFESLVRQAMRAPELEASDADAQPSMHEIDALEVRVAVIYGPEEEPVGARRSFRIEPVDGEEGGYRLEPTTMHTERLTSRRERREVRGWLRDCT